MKAYNVCFPVWAHVPCWLRWAGAKDAMLFSSVLRPLLNVLVVYIRDVNLPLGSCSLATYGNLAILALPLYNLCNRGKQMAVGTACTLQAEWGLHRFLPEKDYQNDPLKTSLR